MEEEYMIAVNDFCTNHNIDISFVSSLGQNGLIEITSVHEESFIESDQLPRLEKFVRMYYDLDINLEGIETIEYLLERINSLQEEVRILKNRLRLYEL